jgi:exopolysaccharide transport family protein
MADSPIIVNPGNASEGEQGFDLREALGFAWRQWKFIVGITLLAVIVGTVYLFNQTPLYTATAEVLLDQPKAKMPGGEAIATDLNFLDAAMLQSQVAIVRSTVLLRRVVERAHLAPMPAAAAKPSDPASVDHSFVASAQNFALKLIGSLSEETEHPDAKPSAMMAEGDAIPPAELRAIGALKGALQVTHGTNQGNVLAISITSPDPVRAAQLANAVADTYLVDKFDMRFDAAKRASAWLSDRLVGLRRQLRDSEEAVAQFSAEHGMVQSGGTTLNQQQLSELNATLIQARADLAQKKARVDLLNSLHAKGGSLESMPDIVNAGQLQDLLKQKATLSAQEADLLARYTGSFPLVVNVRAQLSDVDRSIGVQTAKLAVSIRNEYELARARVSSLESQLRAATGQSSLDDATAVRLRELERTAAVNKTLFEAFLKQAKITQEQSTFEPQEVRIITPAVVPGVPSYPRRTRFITINVLIGLLFGFGGAFAKEKLNSGFTTPKQVEAMLGVPLLTSVSRLTARDLTVDRKSVPIHEFPVIKPLCRYGEAIRSLRSGIHMTDVDHPPKIVQLTSAMPGEGKTTIGLSLAASAAVGKLKVLFIDADLRHPTATRVFGLQKESGLVDLLVGEAGLDTVVKFYDKGGYWVIGCGSKTQNPTDLLGSERMKSLIAAFKESYDLVVLDTPPAGPVSDPIIVSKFSDKIVLVVKWGVTARELVRQTVDQLSGHRKIAGVAFNFVNDREAQKYGKYAYSYYYGYRYYKNYYS